MYAVAQAADVHGVTGDGRNVLLSPDGNWCFDKQSVESPKTQTGMQSPFQTGIKNFSIAFDTSQWIPSPSDGKNRELNKTIFANKLHPVQGMILTKINYLSRLNFILGRFVIKKYLRILFAIILSPCGLWRLLQGYWIGVIYPALWESTVFSFHEGRQIWGAWIALPIIFILWIIDIRSSIKDEPLFNAINIPKRIGFVVLGIVLQLLVFILIMILAMNLHLLIFPHSLR